MKRTIAFLIIGGVLVVGGAGVAWAQTGDRAARRQAVHTCAQEARQQNAGASRDTLKEAVKSCLQAQGFATGQRLTAEQKQQAKACLQAAKDANPGADKVTILAAARPCLEQAGIAKPLTPEQQQRRAKLLSCYEQAKAAHPGDRQAIRQAVRECVRAS